MVSLHNVSCEQLMVVLVAPMDGVGGIVGLADEHAALKGGEGHCCGTLLESTHFVIQGAVLGQEVLVCRVGITFLLFYFYFYFYFYFFTLL